jgi:hypothetical protein
MGAATVVTAGVFAALAVLVLRHGAIWPGWLGVLAATGWVTIASAVLTRRLQG